MRSRFLLALTGGAVIVACSGDAVASLPLSNACYDTGFACFNAGPNGDQAGTCVASTCWDVLDASYACGFCELGDGGGADAGAAPDAESWDASMPDSDVIDATSPDATPDSDGAPSDATPWDGAEGADGQAAGNGSSSGGGSPGSGSSSGSAAASSSGVAASSGGAPDAGAAGDETMPGCSTSPLSRTGPTGFARLALGMAAVARARRRRSPIRNRAAPA
jgi:hypothetical protein